MVRIKMDGASQKTIDHNICILSTHLVNYWKQINGTYLFLLVYDD